MPHHGSPRRSSSDSPGRATSGSSDSEPQLVHRTFVADRGDAGVRLDRAIARHLADVRGISRSRIQVAIDTGRVLMDGQRALRSAQRLSSGVLVEAVVHIDAPPARVVEAQERPLDVLFEDEYFVIVNKPAGWIAHPSFGHADGTLLNVLVHYARAWPGGRPSLVHRLDKHTSGALLVAKTREAHALAVRALRGSAARKEYLALCYGRMRAAQTRLRWPLARDARDRRRVVVDVNGADARTDVARLAESRADRRGLTLVRCRLLTGRTHQIRVHLAAARLPLVGDPIYGQPLWTRQRNMRLRDRLRAFDRQALHAWRLAFAHPFRDGIVQVTAPLPADMTELLACAGLDVPSDRDL